MNSHHWETDPAYEDTPCAFTPVPIDDTVWDTAPDPYIPGAWDTEPDEFIDPTGPGNPAFW
jgi:hypothetical protein